LVLTFFGLTSKEVPKFRRSLFKQIHEIIFHGNGGYNWETVYNMPIWLRKFTFHEINEFYKKENEQHEKAQSKNSNQRTAIPKNGKVSPPNFKVPSKSSYK
tara:strand:+ start:400 stop:702 length:303 start_codon:yes stop_codon:yes gene_type:complete